MNLQGLLVEDRKKDTLLYAGQAQVRITDWFFLRDHIELKYVGLENAIFILNRKDSIWNYQFLLDYFSGGRTTSEKKKGITIDLKKAELKSVYILRKDEWLGENMLVQLKALDLDAEEMNFSTKNVNIKSLLLKEPLFYLKDYKGLKPPKPDNNLPADDKEIKIVQGTPFGDSLLKWNTAGWLVHIDKLKIDNGVLKNDKQADTPYHDFFDGRHIEFSSITGNFNNLNWIKDTITTSIELKAKERSGFEVKSLMADLKFTPKEMSFKKLEIKTNKSIIRNSFAMAYDDMNDLGDFIHKIKMTADFENSEIDSDDIAFFAPELKTWKKKIKISGNTRGTVDDLFGSGMNIVAGQNTYLNGDISLTGLPDIYKTFIDFKANDFRTTYKDASTFLPGIKNIITPRLQNISYLNFTGSFTGFLRDFVTFGTIHTNLGTVVSDLNMKLPVGKDLFYSGTISSDNFSLGEFINNPDIGAISFTGQVKGKGVKWNTLSADLDATIRHIVFKNYPYENIKAKGSLANRIFNGDFSIKDTNATGALKGIVDLSGKEPKFNFLADVEHIDLKKLKLVNENYSFNGKLDFNFSGNNIDNFLGNAKITDANIIKDGKILPLKSLTINSQFVNGIKNLTLNSDELIGQVTGDFSIRELPDAFKLFLNKYYPAYIRKPNGALVNQSFTFDIQTNYIDEYINLLDSNLHGFNNSHVSGELNSVKNQMQLNVDVTGFTYKKFAFQNIRLNGKGNLEKLEVTGLLDRVDISDSLSFPTTQFDLVSQNDHSDIKIVTQSNNRNISGGSINARVQTFNDGVAIVFDSSNFILNGKKWAIEKDGELELRSNTISHGQVVLKEGNQQVTIKTVPSDIGSWNDIKVNLKNFNIGDVAPLLITSNKIEGLISGDISIEDPVNKLNITASLETDEFRLDNDSIGKIKTDVSYNNKSGELKATGLTINQDGKLNFNLDLFLKESAENKEDMITLTPENYPLKIVERFIGNLFTNINGFATGQLKITGKGSNAKYVGKAKLHDAGLKVIFTECYYKIQDTEIEFTENALNLGTLKLIDTITNHSATLTSGIIKHDSWKNMEFDIRANVDNLPMQLLNTTAKDNAGFYGNAKGTGSFSLTGPQSNMIMKMTGRASDIDSSYITIPNTSSRETGIADFLIERKYGREMADSSFQNKTTDITYDIDITGNPMVTVRVVLDELTNDEIRGRGDGNLRILSGTSEPLSIRGRYNINEGNYRFTFQSFFKKPFEMKRDRNNYIEWNGDPYHPVVNIDAVYKTEKKVDFTPLISGAGSATGGSAFRDYVFVIAKLRGDLFKPDISFELDFPPESPPKKDLSVSFVINQLQNNENELNKQVAFLVVFNSFAPSDVGSTLNISSGVDLVVNSISGFLSSQINNVLNNILSNKLKIPGLYVNFSGALYNPYPIVSSSSGTGLGYDRTNLNVSIGKTLFNNRVALTFEGSYDVPLQSSTQVKSDLLSNFTTEFLINKSGTIRATVFYKENVDFLSGTTSAGNNKSKRYGTSLAYRREFNRLSDLFRKKRTPLTEPKQEPKKEDEK